MSEIKQVTNERADTDAAVSPVASPQPPAGGRKPVSNEELAAVIAIGLFQYSKSVHDHENLTLTINRVSRMYSPWSSKFYGLRQIPNKK